MDDTTWAMMRLRFLKPGDWIPEVLPADVVDGCTLTSNICAKKRVVKDLTLVVDEESTVDVLQRRVRGQDRIVRLQSEASIRAGMQVAPHTSTTLEESEGAGYTENSSLLFLP